MTRRLRKMRSTRILVVSFAFLAAQGLALEHRLDADSHPLDEVCAVCLTVSGLGGAAVGKAEPITITRAKHSLPEYSFTSHSPRLLNRQLARGPPTAS